MSVYHQGEIEVQKLAGEELMANRNSRGIAKSIVKGAVNFIEKQPMLILSSVDQNEKIWVSALIGDFGLSQVIDLEHVFIDLQKVKSSRLDPFFQNVKVNTGVGVLFIELATRRRYRINGVIQSLENNLNIKVEEAYPNCPKYIQKRVVSLPAHFNEPNASISRGKRLGKEEVQWIKQADTFFVGSRSIEGKADTSHRGGNPGFIEVLSDGKLRIPDYQGNSMYNTLGNFAQNASAGLLFIDFEHKKTLQLTGKANLQFRQNNENDLVRSTGTGRFWLFETDEWIKIENHHQVNWEMIDYSPFNPNGNKP